MKIVNDFLGANIKVLSQTEDTFNIDVDLRDTEGDWFYWCFKVEDAAGKTVTFNFPSSARVGYYGAAVSHDYKTWHWQYQDKGHQGGSFTYTFKDDENEVYFAHDMLYRPERIYDFAEENKLEIKTLCQTKKGRDVPYFDIGAGDDIIFLTARHHACESTGSYVLEGAFKELIVNKHFEKYRIICVPFVDYDGVVDGDQGKNRKPHDHNRDYNESTAPIYSTTARIRELATALNVKYAFDFHSPWHLGGENDTVFIPIKSNAMVDKVTKFSQLWEKENNASSLSHYRKDDFLPGVSWNTAGAPTAAVFFASNGAELSFSVETPYFCVSETQFSPEKAFNLGRNFACALRAYTENEER